MIQVFCQQSKTCGSPPFNIGDYVCVFEMF
jgi:hypothetical protein